MSRRIQSRFFAFDKVTFLAKPSMGTLVLRITGFANIIIVGFDLAVSEVGDATVGVLNVGYFVKADLWLKPHLDSN
jgi:hypothetical protein